MSTTDNGHPGQALTCVVCDDDSYFANRIRWSGAWPGKLEAEHHGLYCRDEINGLPATMGEVLAARGNPKARWHVPCGKDDEGAHPDLNRWHDLGCPPIPKEAV